MARAAQRRGGQGGGAAAGRRLALAAALAALVAGGCLDALFTDDEPQGPRPTVKVVRPKEAPRANEAAAAAQAEATRRPQYSYSPVGKRDPFRSYLADLDEAARSQQAGKRLKTELERFTLDQLRLTGIVTGVSNPIAMVEDSSGRGHKVQVGTRLGPNGGRVTAILRDRLVITENFFDAAGRKRTVKLDLVMPREVLTLEQ